MLMLMLLLGMSASAHQHPERRYDALVAMPSHGLPMPCHPIVKVTLLYLPLSRPTYHAGGAAVLLLLEGIRTLLANEDSGAEQARRSDVAGKFS